MNTVSVPLTPFEQVPGDASWSSSCQLTVHSGRLELRYQVQGPMEELLLPATSTSPDRRDELWQHTCLECFVGVQGQPYYWELNISPSGDWAFYKLKDYRKGLAPDPGIPQNITVKRDSKELSLQVELDLPRDIPQDAVLDFSPTAVLEHSNGQVSYWARVHPGKEADFHDRRAFATIEQLKQS